MDNTLQKRPKRISLVLTLAAVLFTAVDNYLYLCHGINITPVATPVIIILVVSIVLCGVLQRYIYRWLIKYSLSPSANRQKLEADKTERTRAVVTEQAENRAETIGIEPVKEATDVEARITAGPHRDPYMERYNQMLEEIKQQEARRHAELMEAIREYVTVATAPFLSQKALLPAAALQPGPPVAVTGVAPPSMEHRRTAPHLARRAGPVHQAVVPPRTQQRHRRIPAAQPACRSPEPYSNRHTRRGRFPLPSGADRRPSEK